MIRTDRLELDIDDTTGDVIGLARFTMGGTVVATVSAELLAWCQDCDAEGEAPDFSYVSNVAYAQQVARAAWEKFRLWFWGK